MSSKSDTTEEESSPDEIGVSLDYKVEIIINIIDGKSFRYLIDAVKQIGKTGIFIFKPESMDYSWYNPEINTLLEFTIVKSMLEKVNNCGYQYTSNLKDYPIQLDIDAIKNALSQMNTKDGITLFKPKDENIIYVKRYGDFEGKDTSFSALNIPQMKEIQLMTAPEYNLKECNPTISADLDSFRLKIEPIIKSKHESVLLLATSKEIRITGSSVEGSLISAATITDSLPKISISGLSSLGITPPPVLSVKKEGSLSLSVLKFFKKMKNFSGDDKINFYIEAGNPIKITSTIKNFGFIRMYILCTDK